MMNINIETTYYKIIVKMDIENKTLVDNLTKIKEEFYGSSKKNIFMKKTQKVKLAETINSKICMEDLMINTVCLIPNTNNIYIDYLVFKMYAIPSNYQLIVDRLIEIIITTINKNGSFEIHMNLSSFTITALERFQCVFKLYYDSCIIRGLLYDPNIIDKIVIYNTPSIISSVSLMIAKFTDPSIKNKMVYHSKDVSEYHIKNLLRKTI